MNSKMRTRLITVLFITCMVFGPVDTFASYVSGSWQVDGYASNENKIEYNDSETVKRVQEALNKAGLDCGEADGKLGPKTENKIRMAERKLGITESGTITDELLSNLSKLPKHNEQEVTVFELISAAGQALGAPVDDTGNIEEIPETIQKAGALYEHGWELQFGYNADEKRVISVEFHFLDAKHDGPGLASMTWEDFGLFDVSPADNPYSKVGFGNIRIWNNIEGHHVALCDRQGDDFFAIFDDTDQFVYSANSRNVVLSNPLPTPTPKENKTKDGSDSSISISSANQSSKSNESKNSTFTNAYGTPTTKCAHPGCNNYIAPSGDTNCCTIHSNRCLECKKYIDEDAMYCMSCLKKAITAGSSTTNENDGYSYDSTDPYYSANDHNSDGKLNDAEFQDALNDFVEDLAEDLGY